MIYNGSTTIITPSNKFFNVTDSCQTLVTPIPFATITLMMDYIKGWYEQQYGGSFVWGYSGTTLRVVFKPDIDPVDTTCGELEKISFGAIGLTDLILTRAEPCDTCQEIVFNSCPETELIFEEIPFEVNLTILDHQSGVQYTQYSITGYWNLSNSAGIFTPFSVYTLTVTDQNGQPVSWAYLDKEYTCARFTFVNSVDTNPVE